MHANRLKLETLNVQARKLVSKLSDEVQETENLLAFIVSANTELAHLHALSGISKNLRKDSTMEFEAKIRLSTLRFRLEAAQQLQIELQAVLMRDCAECKNTGTVTYAADDRDQRNPVTTPCPKCDGVCKEV
ncbi:MAG: hypothetical protein KBC02_02015 [Candidatus Pacebacteria bacterium]|nr:hypothetical protein [Candidatus Paceibacterota bacterium]